MDKGKNGEGAEGVRAADITGRNIGGPVQLSDEARWNRLSRLANILLAVGTGILLLLVSAFCYLLALGYADMAYPGR